MKDEGLVRIGCRTEVFLQEAKTLRPAAGEAV
jgi:hypothetical protein